MITWSSWRAVSLNLVKTAWNLAELNDNLAKMIANLAKTSIIWRIGKYALFFPIRQIIALTKKGSSIIYAEPSPLFTRQPG